MQHVTANARKYAVYHGPNGERAPSRVAAWRAAARANQEGAFTLTLNPDLTLTLTLTLIPTLT